MTMWKYCWESPDPVRWKSDFTFNSFESARDSAIFHARNERKRKNRFRTKPDENQSKKVWRSMKSLGWKIRKKRVKN